MKNRQYRKINIEPIYTFLTEDIRPSEFAELLDNLLFHYIMMLIELQQDDRVGIHEKTIEFIHYLKLLRDILPECEKK